VWGDVTGCQAQGSQPVQVRSGETPGSPVAGLPASVERLVSKRSDEHPLGVSQPAGPQHQVKPAASLQPPPVRAGQGGAEPVLSGRRPRKASWILERASRNLPAQGAWNGRRVVLGTGEDLLGPGAAAREAGPAYNRWSREVAGCREVVGGGHSTAGAGRTTQPPVREGPLLHRCVSRVRRRLG
jgi:hypothetical protein